MVGDVDSTYILYGLGALLGIAAIVYFGWEVLLSMSPTVKSVLLFLAFAFLLLAGLHAGREALDTVLVVLSAGAYLVFLGYTVFRFEPTTNQVFLGLALSSGLFIGIAYAVRSRDFELPGESLEKVLAGMIVIAVILVAVDVLGPRPAVETDLVGTVNVSAAEEGKVFLGTVEMENPFFLSRTAEVPGYEACIVTDNRSERWTAITRTGTGFGGSVLLRGNEREVMNLTARFPVGVDRGGRPTIPGGLGTVPVVEREECPGTLEEPSIVVAERGFPD